jgi:hypothetical protein
LFQELGFLHPVHVEGWRKRHEAYPVLEKWIQVGPEKRARVFELFAVWVAERGLQPVGASYAARTARGVVELQVTADGDPAQEKFFRTHYAPAGLAPKQAARLTAKLHKEPDIVVFVMVSDSATCAECGADVPRGEFGTKEGDKLLCLTCADLDHLEFLPAGDTAMTRRSKKYSPLSAVVVRFNRSHQRYERQGLLVAADAIAQAESECAEDAPQRAAARAQAAVQRTKEDRELVAAMEREILGAFPGCPPSESHRIAEHTASRGSGRVGRSAAGRALDPRALELAVIAHIRHEHTNYDRLLMQGVERLDARGQVRDAIDGVVRRWRRNTPVA